ncbi:Fatty acid desaturase (Delta-4 desaturase) [Quillaja saponaria]|uniref:Fatty acid desaturase (Delta-4 desaturase) n=1 Tax=Quillaja saponaria TaxID=32244 RepID=A0AAD7LAZ0_QUISA|nr:Fatty acid desaturase (Delta-4 desaturase) [Quillaja saponaria]
MEDVITEIPPPSRFFEEDLNNFTVPSPPLPPPFLLFSEPHLQTLHPSLLIIALSSPSLYLFHHFPSKTLIGSLILPEIPLSGNSIEPSLTDRSCNIYALNNGDPQSVVLVSVQCSVAAERSHSVAKLLIGDRIVSRRMLILDSIHGQNFRGRLSSDEEFAFKLETLAERKGERLLKGLEYYPSGSVVDGLGAALLGRCQMKNIKASLCVSWPEYGASVLSLIKGLLQKDVLPGLELNFSEEDSSGFLSRFGRGKDHLFESELYT